jgi:hypothetical protein
MARFLSFVQKLALVAPIGCASSPPPTTPPTPEPAASTSAAPETTTETTAAGTGPCRCSWDTDAATAPRVCHKGEINYQGAECVPGTGKKYYKGPIKGPLPPPDLPVV